MESDMDDRIHNKLDKIIEDVSAIKEDLSGIKIVQAKQDVTLDHHVYRSDLLEDIQKIMKSESQAKFDAISKDIEPLKSFKDKIIGALKWTSFIVAVLGVLFTALKVIGH